MAERYRSARGVLQAAKIFYKFKLFKNESDPLVFTQYVLKSVSIRINSAE